jgi:hypothetical protein
LAVSCALSSVLLCLKSLIPYISLDKPFGPSHGAWHLLAESDDTDSGIWNRPASVALPFGDDGGFGGNVVKDVSRVAMRVDVVVY